MRNQAALALDIIKNLMPLLSEGAINVIIIFVAYSTAKTYVMYTYDFRCSLFEALCCKLVYSCLIGEAV